jgi:predicted glycoside hydrolase/deacetylase ChbG (UPF0249 family)
MHPAIDGAVIRLAESGRVSSASVMVLGASGENQVAELRRLQVALGLHLDFTSAMFNRRYSSNTTLRALMAETWARRLAPARAEQIISEQLERFETIAGQLPTFIDGHQHVHQFPVIRDSLIKVLAARYPGKHFYLRNTVSSCWRGSKATVIARLGGPRLRALADREGHRYNIDFCGVYDFSERSDLRQLWRGWLSSLPPYGGLVMCHPGFPSERVIDEIDAARNREFRFLNSEQFAELTDEFGIDVVGWNDRAWQPAGRAGN